MSQQTHPSDLTERQWQAVEPLIPPPVAGGRPRVADMRAVVNALRYLVASGCGWRGLPASFPHRSTVRHYYDVWREAGVWVRIEAATAAPVCPNDAEYEGTPSPGGGTS